MASHKSSFPRITVCFLILVLLGLYSAHSVAQESAESVSATITIDPATIYSVNGITETQGVNGVVVNGESRMQNAQETLELKVSTTKLFLWVKVLDIHWKEIRDKKKTDAWKDEILVKWREIDFDKKVPEAFDQSLALDPTTGKTLEGKRPSPQFWQLEQLSAWDATKNVVLHFHQPHPATEDDFPAYLRYYRACIREVQKRYPDLGPLYVMIFNEPDLEYPRLWEKRNTPEAVAFFYSFFNYLNQELKREFPDVTLIGPGISGFMNWASWENWTVPFVKQVPETNYFNAQPYCRRFTDLLAWTQMLQAESMRVNGKRLGMILTETNMGGLHQPSTEWWLDEYHTQRVFDEYRGLFGFFDNPDVFSLKHYFIYHYSRNWMDMWFRRDGKDTAAPVYWAYRMIRDLQGTRLLDQVDREDSPLKTYSIRNGNEILCGVFNQAQTPTTARVQVLWPQGVGASECVEEFFRYDSSAKQFERGSLPPALLPSEVNFAPGEMKTFRWTLPEGALPLTGMHAVERQTFYAPATNLVVNRDEQKTAIAARVPSTHETVRLQMAFYLDDLLSLDALGWRLNGHEMEAQYIPEAYDQGRVHPILFVDTLVPLDWVNQDNVIHLHPAKDSVYRLMFASLSYMPRPESFPAIHRTDSFVKRPKALELQLSMPSGVAPGKVPVTLQVQNNTTEQQTVTFQIDAPAGWSLSNPSGAIDIPANGSSLVSNVLLIPAGGMRESHYLSATASAPGHEVAATKRGTVCHVPFEAEYAETEPVLDGQLTEWNPSSFVIERHEGAGVEQPFTTRLAAKWDSQAVYFALVVEGRELKSVPIGSDKWWSYDTLELFFDLWNQRKSLHDHQAKQAALVLLDENTGEAQLRSYPRDPNGVSLPPETPSSFRLFCLRGQNGFTVEAKLDWMSLAENRWMTADTKFLPTANMVLGLEVALAGRSLLGARIKEYANPSKWGWLKLLPKGTKAAIPQTPVILDISPRTGVSSSPAPLTQFDRSHTAGWTYPKTAVLGDAGLRLPNSHAVLMYSADEFKGIGGGGRSAKVTIAEFGRDSVDTLKFRSHARIFLTPQPGPINEPYSLKEMLCLVVGYREQENTTLTLYAKTPPQKNWGKLLWSGTISSGTCPFTVTMHVDQTTYRITCDKPVTPRSGSLSGYHELPAERWGGALRFGIKSCFGTVPGYVTVSNVEIR